MQIWNCGISVNDAEDEIDICNLVIFLCFLKSMRELVIFFQPAQEVVDPPVHNSRINDAIIFMRVLSYPSHLVN